MVLQENEKDKVRALLVEAITVLCKNGLNYDELTVEGLIGITLNKKDVFLVNINQSFVSSDAELSEDEGKSSVKIEKHLSSKRARRRASGSKRAMSDRSDAEDDSQSMTGVGLLDTSSRLSGGEPAHKRKHSDTSSIEPEVSVKQEQFDDEDEDEDLIIMHSEEPEGGGNQFHEYSANTSLPNLGSDSSFSQPGCSTWSLSQSQMPFNPSAQPIQGDQSQLDTSGNANVFHHAVADPAPVPPARVKNLVKAGSPRNVCPLCGKVLAYPSAVVLHMRTHTGHRPHTCCICNKGFTQKGSLLTHIKKLHPDQADDANPGNSS